MLPVVTLAVGCFFSSERQWDGLQTLSRTIQVTTHVAGRLLCYDIRLVARPISHTAPG